MRMVSRLRDMREHDSDCLNILIHGEQTNEYNSKNVGGLVDISLCCLPIYAKNTNIEHAGNKFCIIQISYSPMVTRFYVFIHQVIQSIAEIDQA